MRGTRTWLWLGLAHLALVAQADEVIVSDDLEWGLLNPARGEASPKAVDLWGDRTRNQPTGMLVKFAKGFSSPPHIHNITYRAVVISGLLHNDDPAAAPMWLPTGSYWTQPAGEVHITAADGNDNLIYLEIDAGPYLVEPQDQQFDNGERAINLHANNLVWLKARDSQWIENGRAEITHLWGKPDHHNGSFIRLPPRFSGSLSSINLIKAVVIKGQLNYRKAREPQSQQLPPSSFFRSNGRATHHLRSSEEVILYIHSDGGYVIE